jgi:arsenite methyltransferase
MQKRPDYGIDSPGIVAGLLAAGVVMLGLAGFFPHAWGLPTKWIERAAAAYFFCGAAGMLFYSRVGKLQNREQLLDLIPWRGDERVLDVGCGRGLLLAGAARRLTTGKAVGVDVWNPGAITGNRAAAVLQNAWREGVSDRAEAKAGDARQLPFPDNSFDVVVSNFVVHEMNTAAERQKMMQEMVRVLKPGGRLALVDFIFTGECVRVLQHGGMDDAKRLRVGTISFWISAILNFGACQTYQVIGSKNRSGTP